MHKITLDKLKKYFRLIHYLESDLEYAEYVKDIYSQYLGEELEVIEVEVDLNVKIVE